MTCKVIMANGDTFVEKVKDDNDAVKCALWYHMEVGDVIGYQIEEAK
jgi:hypothetical protein